MKKDYLHILISAETVEQATAILDTLLEKKVITGGPILQGPAKFWWKRKVAIMNYCYILTYSKDMYREEIEKTVREVSEEEVPMISFIPFDGNRELLEWIDSIVG
jgi:uncharacterized protein involved in tolerance to divalent cations